MLVQPEIPNCQIQSLPSVAAVVINKSCLSLFINIFPLTKVFNFSCYSLGLFVNRERGAEMG